MPSVAEGLMTHHYEVPVVTEPTVGRLSQLGTLSNSVYCASVPVKLQPCKCTYHAHMQHLPPAVPSAAVRKTTITTIAIHSTRRINCKEYSFGLSPQKREIQKGFGKICAKIHFVLLKKEANAYHCGKGWEHRMPQTDVTQAQTSA